MYLVLGQDKPGKPAKKGFAKEVWDAGMAELEKRGAPGVRAKVEEISNRALNTQCFDIGLLVSTLAGCESIVILLTHPEQ